MSVWEKVGPSLHAADYWSKTECRKWSAADYSSFLLLEYPSLNKRSVMKMYSADIGVLTVHFKDMKMISSRLTASKKIIGKDESLNQFWREHSAEIKSLSSKRKLNQYSALTTVEENAVKALCTESNTGASSSSSSSSSLPVPSSSGSKPLPLSTDTSSNNENTGVSNTNTKSTNDNDDEKVEHDEVSQSSNIQ